MKYTDGLTRRKINIDITNKCTLECGKCLRRHISSTHLGDMSFETYYKVLHHFHEIILCGNQSDPIFHPHFIEFLKLAGNMHRQIAVDTSASHKPMEFYKEAFDANKDVFWRFGLDGLPKDSHKYRVNQDGEHLFEVMKMGAANGNNINWQYIIFNYNENNIEEAKKLATDHNIVFELHKSSRYSGPEDPLLPSEGNYV